MSDTTSSIAPDARPRLPHGVRLVHSEAQGGWVLLAPERIFKADTIDRSAIEAMRAEQLTVGEAASKLPSRE